MKTIALSSILAAQPRNGWSPPAEYQTNTGIPVLTLSSVTGFEYNGSRVKLSSAPTRDDAHYWLEPGELLITRSNTQELVGHAAIYDGTPARAICCDLIMKMRVDPKRADTRYVHLYLQSPKARSYLMGRAHGASSTMKKIGKEVVQNIPVPLPPLPEQQRIVGILDEAFAGIATAKANAEKNLQNARALFESHLHAVFTRRGPGWVEKSVSEIAAPAKGSIRTGPFGSQLLHNEFVDEGIAVLGIDNAVANEFRWGKSRFITEEKYRLLERYTVHPGDVLITIMGTCGRCAIVPDDIPTAINTKHICCITLDRKQCLPSYLHIYFLHAPQSQEFLGKHAKGAIMAGLNMGLIKELPVALPPIGIQKAIVDAANALQTETRRLEALYARKLAALDELKTSLLHQAFSGQL